MCGGMACALSLPMQRCRSLGETVRCVLCVVGLGCTAAPSALALDIPIFLFAISSGRVLIDGTLVAKAMPAMILAVQLAEAHWPTQLTCGGRTPHVSFR